MRNIICDVDGCLVPPRGEMWDHIALGRLAELVSKRLFRFTLCSGRPATFMEALARQLVITSYLICENGSLLFHPMTKKSFPHPGVSLQFLQDRPDILRWLDELTTGTSTIIEVGKEIMISVNPPDKSKLADLCTTITKQLRGMDVEVVNSTRSIEVIPIGVNKAAGLEFWAELEKVNVENTLSIGDADNDLEILKKAGLAAAPANCTKRVRDTVDYISQSSMIKGVIDICHWAIK